MNLANYILFSIIIITAFINTFIRKQKSWSVNKFIWLYVFLFWGIVPLVQYAVGIFPWGVDISPSLAMKANLVTLLWIAVYKITYKLFGGEKRTGSDGPVIQDFSINNLSIIFLILYQLLIMAYFFRKTGGPVLLRGDLTSDMFSSGSNTYLVVTQVFRASSFFATAAFAYWYRSKDSLKSLLLLAFSFLLMLLTNFPLALPRYMAGAFYMGLFFILVPDFRRRYIPALLMLFIFLVLYPALAILRVPGQSAGEIGMVSSVTPFLTGDFDNFSTLSMTIDYVKENGITWGKQLSGVLLFFVPSALWTGKPVGSGAFIAGSRNWDFTNISCPYNAEGFINFGLFGVVIFAVVMAYIVVRIDAAFYRSSRFSYLRLFYPVMLGMIMFIIRGDLMSSFAYTISFIVAAFIIFMIIDFPSFIHVKNDRPQEE